MRIVAGEAFPPAEGVVEDRSPRLQLGFIVALVAERFPLFRHREGRLGIGRRVARVAAFLRHGIVRARFQERFSGGGVRIVASRAGGRFHGVVPVRFLEAALSGIVTGEAQRGLRLDEQVGLGGAVGAVADPAPLLLEDGVDHLLLIRLFLVARVARLRAFRLQEMAPLGAVRVVARGAFSRFQDRVDVGLVQPDLLLGMAGVAQFVPVLFQQELGNDPVPEVAIFALPFLHAGVQGLEGEVFLGKLLVAVEAPFPLELPLLRPGRSVGSEEGRSRKGRGSSQ